MDTRLVSYGSSATLQDRLATRRRFHQKRLSSESSSSQSPVSRSLDRSSSQRSTNNRRAVASLQSVSSLPSSTPPNAPRKASAIRSARADLSRIQPLPPTGNPVIVTPPIQGTVHSSQSSSQVQSFDDGNRQSPRTHEHQEKVEVNREIISKSPPVPFERTRPPHDNQPLVLPPIQNGVKISPRQPSSRSESHTESDAHFPFPSLPPKTMPRTTSEQTLPSHLNNLSSRDRSFTHQRSLALSYVFNQRLIDAQFTSTSISNIAENPKKTVWD